MLSLLSRTKLSKTDRFRPCSKAARAHPGIFSGSAKHAWLSLLGLCLSVSAGSVALADLPVQAEAVLSRYYNALQSGDVATMDGLLGGRLLARQRALLSNPTYPEHLRDAYADRSFRFVERDDGEDSGRIIVEVEEKIADDEIIRLRYTLQPSTEGGPPELRIVDVLVVP